MILEFTDEDANYEYLAPMAFFMHGKEVRPEDLAWKPWLLFSDPTTGELQRIFRKRKGVAGLVK